LDAEHVIAEAKALRETSAALRKDARQLCDTAGLVRAEAEAERQKKRNGTKALATGVLHVRQYLS
jgi:hypothetical protein